MPRKPQVRYFETRGAYYTQINKKQYLLAKGPDDFPDGPTYKAAFTAYYRLLEAGNLHEAGATASVRAILDGYLQACERKIRKNTFQGKLRALKLFSERHGDVRIHQVKPVLVEEFIREMRSGRMVPHGERKRLVRWTTAGTERSFLNHLIGAFNWAVKQQILPYNPLSAMELPNSRTKARERILTDEEKQTVLAALTDKRSCSLRNLVLALENTGARPGELAGARVVDFKPELGAIVYYADDKRREDEFAHKTSKKKDRVIYFTGAALELVKQLCKDKKLTAPIFHTRFGGCYESSTIANCFRDLRERVGMPHLVAYAYRHTFATRWLMAGGSIDDLAELLGNSPDVIRKHYSHLCKQHEYLRSRLEAFHAKGT